MTAPVKPAGRPSDIRLRAQAYARLGVSPSDVLAAPRITPLIRDLASPPSLAEGWRSVLDALRASDHSDARRFLQHYDDITIPLYCRRLLPIEAWCIRAGLNPALFWETIVLCLVRMNARRGVALAAMAHPEIVKVSIDQAMLPDGIRDREWQLKNAGFLPLPKGNVTNIQVAASAQSASSAASFAPSPESTVRRLTDRFNELHRSTPDLNALPALIDAPALPAPSDPAVPTFLDAMAASHRIVEAEALIPEPESEEER